MCIAVPGKVLSIEGGVATVSFGGSLRAAQMDLIDDIKEGDYVIVHAGFILRKIDEKEAQETLNIMREIGLEIS